MTKGKTPPIKPGQKSTESGIYESSKSGTRKVIGLNEKAPPTPKKGETWGLDVPTKKK